MTQPTPGVTDADIRDSVMIIKRQRTTKLILVLGGIVAVAVIASLLIVAAYNDEPDAAKSIPAAH